MRRCDRLLLVRESRTYRRITASIVVVAVAAVVGGSIVFIVRSCDFGRR